MDQNIIHVNDDIKKLLTKQEVWRFNDENSDSLFDIKNLNYKINNEFIDVEWFDSKFPASNETYYMEIEKKKIYKDKKFQPKKKNVTNLKFSYK